VASAAILAGGQARRFGGRDKSELRVGGRRILERQLDELRRLTDDILHLKPATKLIAQLALASALLQYGYRLNWLQSMTLDTMLTLVWVVGLTNAFNLIDNMDGLCGGIAIVAGSALLVEFASLIPRPLCFPRLASIRPTLPRLRPLTFGYWRRAVLFHWPNCVNGF